MAQTVLQHLGIPIATHKTQRKGPRHYPLQTVLQHLGIPIATHKTEGPAILVAFLGILIDTEKFKLRLPSDKVERLQSLLGDWSSRRACTRKELESLLEHCR